MIQILIFVEGWCEEAFINNYLNPYLNERGIFITPTKITTSIKERSYKGGIGDKTYGQLRKDILKHNHQVYYFSCFFDYYGLPDTFPGMDLVSNENDPYKIVDILENTIKADIGIPTFIPYIQLHEFESLLFTDIDKIDSNLELYNPRSQIRELRRIKDTFQNPELINNSKITAPSKRLQKLYPNYEKYLHGLHIIDEIPIQKIRSECAHFNNWVSTLEQLPPLQ